jgi:hypothetical protein
MRSRILKEASLSNFIQIKQGTTIKLSEIFLNAELGFSELKISKLTLNLITRHFSGLNGNEQKL